MRVPERGVIIVGPVAAVAIFAVLIEQHRLFGDVCGICRFLIVRADIIDVRHLEPPFYDGERDLSLDQLQRIAPELFKPPAFQNGEALTLPGSQRLQIVAPREQP